MCIRDRITVYVGALTAYGFAKYKFKYNKQLFWLVLATMMLPGQLGIIGYFPVSYTHLGQGNEYPENSSSVYGRLCG